MTQWRYKKLWREKMKTLVEHKAPYFKMNAATGDGEQLKEVALDDYEGQWLVMFFYPLDFTDV